MCQTWEEFFSCILCILHVFFPIMGQNYTICSIGYILVFTTYFLMPHASISKPDDGLSQTETCSALVRQRIEVQYIKFMLC